jgi:hypothetical protein
MLGRWPCDWAFIQVSEASLTEEGRTHRTTKFGCGISTFCCKCNKLNPSSASLFFVIGIPNLASPPPPPPPSCVFRCPCPRPYQHVEPWFNFAAQLTTACKDSWRLIHTKEIDQIELRRERYKWVEVRRSFYEWEGRGVCWLVCQMWGEAICVRWCSSIDSP